MPADPLTIPKKFRRKPVAPQAVIEETAGSEFHDTAALKPVVLVPGKMAYAWLCGNPGKVSEGGDGVEWPVSGWAPYVVWRWTARHVELWYPTQLARVRVPRNHQALRHVRSAGDMTPSEVAARIERAIATYDRLGMPYLTGAPGVASFLKRLESFDEAVDPAPLSEFETGGEGERTMAKAKKQDTEGKKGRGPGSGAWIREQLIAMHQGKAKQRTDEDLAAEARQKFGGKTGTSDVAWNRNKLRKEGALPASTRGKKAAAPAKPAKNGKKMDAKSAKLAA